MGLAFLVYKRQHSSVYLKSFPYSNDMGYIHANRKAFFLALLFIVRVALSTLAETGTITELFLVYFCHFGLCIFLFSFYKALPLIISEEQDYFTNSVLLSARWHRISPPHESEKKILRGYKHEDFP